MISIQILTLITSHPKHALTSQNGDGVPACIIWFTLCVWSEVDMKGWTHLSFWRLWFTCNAADNSWAPLTEIRFHLRLQNVRWKVVQQTSTLCVKYIWCRYLTTETHYQILRDCLSVSKVEDYKHITMTTCRKDNDLMGIPWETCHHTPSLSMVWSWNKAAVTAHRLRSWTKWLDSL